MSKKEDSPAGLEEEAESSSEEESSSDEDMEVEFLAPTRARRANAGNKMMSLIESSIQEDEFYKNAYEGGFNENDEDVAFESPGHSDVDEVDSDFDRPEEEEQPVSDKEDEEKRPKRKRAFKEPPRGNELLAKNKWAVARMGGPVVAANVVDAKTQAQRLKEAEETERVNTESLKRYEATELDKKKKREKSSIRRRVPPPLVAYRSAAAVESFTVPELKTFKESKVQKMYICPVTGRPAKYKDPLTDLPYASPFAFKVIRDQYNKFLLERRNDRNVEPEVVEYLSQFALDSFNGK